MTFSAILKHNLQTVLLHHIQKWFQFDALWWFSLVFIDDHSIRSVALIAAAMAGGIDTSKRKARQLRGTPALKFINILSLISITAGLGLGCVF